MDPFVAEIRIFPFNFAPKGWAFCNGQLMPISQNTALFSLLGTFYGGDGRSTFGLPNLQGSLPLHVGSSQGPGLSLYSLGEAIGSETTGLVLAQMAAHTHSIMAEAAPANSKAPAAGSSVLGRSSGGNAYLPPDAAVAPMAPGLVGSAGGGNPHNNLMPYLTLNFCIALQGIYPPRS